MKTKDNTIIINAITSSVSDELNYSMYNDVLGEEKVETADEESGVHEIHSGIEHYTESNPIKISELREILDKFETKGCNYVSIDFNCDHDEYEFCGYDVHTATKDEIELFNEEENKKRLKRAEDQLAKLESDKENLLAVVLNRGKIT